MQLPTLLAVDAVAALDGDTMAFVDLMRMLRTFATSAFRLEARQLYNTDGEAAAFAAWMQFGRIPDAADPLISDWTEIVRARVEVGAVMRRVRGRSSAGVVLAGSDQLWPEQRQRLVDTALGERVQESGGGASGQ